MGVSGSILQYLGASWSIWEHQASERSWEYLGAAGSTRDLGASDSIWEDLAVLGDIWEHLGSGSSWEHLGASGSIMSGSTWAASGHLGAAGSISACGIA